MTSKGPITIRLAIRRKRRLDQGTVLEFDEGADHLKATKAAVRTRMSAVIGIAEDDLAGKTVSEWTDVLAGARADGDLVACDVVAAEFFALLAAGRPGTNPPPPRLRPTGQPT